MIAAGDEAGGTGGGRAGAWRVRAGGREDARADTREEAGGGGDALGRSGCAMEMAHYFGFNVKLSKSDYPKLEHSVFSALSNLVINICPLTFS
jgi:hypothetical protein